MNVEDKAKVSADIRIRKVKVLQGRAREEAMKQNLNHIEKIDGDPVSYLLKRAKEN